jgi:hypothetical protein
MGLATIFYCRRLEISLFVASYDSQGYGGTPHGMYIECRNELPFITATRPEYTSPRRTVNCPLLLCCHGNVREVVQQWTSALAPLLRFSCLMAQYLTYSNGFRLMKINFCCHCGNKLHGFSPQANYADRQPPLVGEVSANFCG